MGLERTAAGQPTPQPARFLAPAVAPDARWLEGNTHTHTTNSDGDTAPDEVARWYKSTRYNFLVLSEFFLEHRHRRALPREKRPIARDLQRAPHGAQYRRW